MAKGFFCAADIVVPWSALFEPTAAAAAAAFAEWAACAAAAATAAAARLDPEAAEAASL